jgi:hypothetical protein
MAYAVMMLAVLGAFLWATPAHTAIADAIHRIDTAALQERVNQRIDSTVATVRTKSMELLREQFHAAINDLIR